MELIETSLLNSVSIAICHWIVTLNDSNGVLILLIIVLAYLKICEWKNSWGL